jgi:hypothetical protein
MKPRYRDRDNGAFRSDGDVEWKSGSEPVGGGSLFEVSRLVTTGGCITKAMRRSGQQHRSYFALIDYECVHAIGTSCLYWDVGLLSVYRTRDARRMLLGAWAP